MKPKKCGAQAENELKEEIKSINDKGYNTVLVKDKDQRDKRRFTKIFDIKLNDLIYNGGIERKYINFFILLVNLNSAYIEPDLNLIHLPIKEIAKNLDYSTVHLYNCLKVLKENNLIDYYKSGRSNYIVINPCYYARFYNVNFMYMLDKCFNKNKADITTVLNQIMIDRIENQDRKNKYIDRKADSLLSLFLGE